MVETNLNFELCSGQGLLEILESTGVVFSCSVLSVCSSYSGWPDGCTGLLLFQTWLRAWTLEIHQTIMGRNVKGLKLKGVERGFVEVELLHCC